MVFLTKVPLVANKGLPSQKISHSIQCQGVGKVQELNNLFFAIP